MAISGDTAIVGAYFDEDGRGSAYVFTMNSAGGWEEKTKLASSDGSSSYDEFGWSVAISGSTAIIGAPGDDENHGSAYVFAMNNGGDWEQQDKLTAGDDATISDYFGASVAISGNTAIIGDHGGDDNAGSAYVFVRTGTTVWENRVKLTADDAAEGDAFGLSVAISGNTAIIGAQGDGKTHGSAYVFAMNSGGDWEQQDKLTAGDDATISDYFGASVAISGNTAIIGADGENEIQGSAYVFTQDTTTEKWTQKAKLRSSDSAISDSFGWSVAISGNTSIIGADGNDDRKGFAYVFVLDSSTGSWKQQAELTSSDSALDDHFGSSVAISGNPAIVGAPFDEDNGASSGSAYVFPSF